MADGCPVCGEALAGLGQLAGHLRTNASDDAHASWLETHLPEWEDGDALPDRALEAALFDLSAEAERSDADYDDGPERPIESDDFTTDDHDPGVTFDEFGGGPTARPGPSGVAARAALEEGYETGREHTGDDTSPNPDDAELRRGADATDADETE